MFKLVSSTPSYWDSLIVTYMIPKRKILIKVVQSLDKYKIRWVNRQNLPSWKVEEKSRKGDIPLK